MKGLVKSILGQRSKASRVVPVQTDSEKQSLVPGECYFELGVAQVHVADLEGLLKTYAPLVFSEVSATFGSRRIELQQVIDPRKELWSSNGREHQGYRRLVSPMPYVDHQIDFRIGLFRVLSKDHASTVIKLLSTLSANFLPQHKMLEQLATTLNDGVNELVSDSNSFIAGHSVEFRQKAPLTPGTYVVTSDTELGKAPLWFADGVLKEGKNLEFAIPWRNADFIVYTVDIKESREDYLSIEQVNGPYSEAMEAVQKRNVDNLNKAFDGLKGAVMTSPTFTLADARRIIVALETDLRQRWDIVKVQAPAFTMRGDKQPVAPDLPASVSDAQVHTAMSWRAT